MTAEALVMNKYGIAIAADSAITIDVPNTGPKIYNTVNKLFGLTARAPVAIMVYGTVEFAGLPWETLIKDYRDKLNDRTFDTVDEYAREFLQYLQQVETTEDDQCDMLFNAIFGHFTRLTRELKSQIRKERSGRGTTRAELQQKIVQVLTQVEESIASLDDILSLKIDQRQFISNYRHEIFAARSMTIMDAFATPLFTREALKKVWNLSYLYTIKEIFSPSSSGIVIAGFGNRQLLPSVREYTIDGIICDQMKYKLTTKRDITKNNQGMVIPFAQTEIVHRFMSGVDKSYQDYVCEMFETLVNEIPKYIIQEFLKESEENNISKIMKDIVDEKLKHIHQAMTNYRHKYFTRPIIDAVKGLPKNELATLAEALVQITSLKRKMSTDVETVGEPIDTVVISKGDGLVWIKRKQYYDPSLNQRNN